MRPRRYRLTTLLRSGVGGRHVEGPLDWLLNRLLKREGIPPDARVARKIGDGVYSLYHDGRTFEIRAL